MSASTVIYVLDYQAMGRTTARPRCLHRTDCTHPDVHAIWRKATPAELKLLPECQDCARRHLDG
jgi:hypothetical protein